VPKSVDREHFFVIFTFIQDIVQIGNFLLVIFLKANVLNLYNEANHRLNAISFF
jgi:hypothetical protein